MTAEEAAASSGVHRSTVFRLLARVRQGGWAALNERPSTPRRQPRRLPAQVEAEILAVRARTQAGPVVIGAIVGRAASTVGKVLRRFGRSRLPKPLRDPVVRYERERPGELVHVDIKKLGRFFAVGKRILGDSAERSRGAGWHFLHVAVDDHSRLAYAELLPSERKPDCLAFLERALAWYSEQGIVVERVLSDNGNGYRSHEWKRLCADNGVRPRYTRTRRPQTNGKAEALIKTLLREWAYHYPYPTSEHRTRALPGYLRWYNRRRPHSSLGGRPPLSRVADLCGQYT